MIPVEAVNGNLELLELAEWKGEATSIDDFSENGYRVYQNYPNPFSGSTTVSFDLPKAERVTIEIFDLYGRKLQFFDEHFPAGMNRVEIGDGLANGVYYLRLNATGYSGSLKICKLH